MGVPLRFREVTCQSDSCAPVGHRNFCWLGEQSLLQHGRNKFHCLGGVGGSGPGCVCFTPRSQRLRDVPDDAMVWPLASLIRSGSNRQHCLQRWKGSWSASAPCNASKAAVINLTRSAAKALTSEIAANSVCPGHVDTALRSRFVEEASGIIVHVDFDAAAASAQWVVQRSRKNSPTWCSSY